MKYFGVVYDIGYRVFGEGGSSVEPFDPDLVRYDMNVIADDLQANAVRIEGEDLARLEIASRAALDAGLAIWFSPWKMNVDFDATTEYLVEAAKIAERLVRDGGDVVFIVSCEYSIFSDGVYPGNNIFERSAWVKQHFGAIEWPNIPAGLPDPLPQKAEILNQYLKSFRDTVRGHFSGPVTYSAAIFEDVDWTLFDYAGPNYYRETQSDEEYAAGFEYFRTFGKPIAIPEFGCCTYVGAAGRGARGWRLLQEKFPDGSVKWQNDDVPVRSETEQADYAERQLRFFQDQGVEAAFIFQYNAPGYVHDEGARDADLGSYGMVKFPPRGDARWRQMPPWEPKKIYHRAAKVFRELRETAK
ncbi:hypothetical protein [Streptomyces shenzhenensis]|uniref:hypothetical protein n=1 Tax=Streptomyces shenzhenensis TaxID=943815 RepID=UPI00340B2424